MSHAYQDQMLAECGPKPTIDELFDEAMAREARHDRNEERRMAEMDSRANELEMRVKALAREAMEKGWSEIEDAFLQQDLPIGICGMDGEEIEPLHHGSELAAGYDLKAHFDCLLHPGEIHQVWTGVRLRIPAGWVGLVRDRSGKAAKEGLTTRAGVIDSDYTGQIKVVVRNDGGFPVTVKRGDRIAQIIFVRHGRARFVHFNPSESNLKRGDKGFGSTGG